MATLKEIRAAYPEYAQVPDDVLSEALYKKFGEGQDKDNFLLGLQGRGDKISPFQAGVEGLKSSGEMLVARTAQALGAEETAQDYLKRSQARDEDTDARYKPETRSFDDVDSAYKFGRYMYERFGESAPQMLLMAAGGVGGLAARGVAGAVGLAAARGLSADAAMSLGSTVAGAGAYTGSNLQRQIQEGTKFEDTSLAGAGAAALGQSALDTLSLRTIFKGISAPVAGSRTAAAAQRALESGATEALTETGQQALEILQANPGKLYSFSDDVQKELKDAAIAGGLLGAGMGGVGGALTYRKGKAAEPEKKSGVGGPDMKGPGKEGEETDTETEVDTTGNEPAPPAAPTEPSPVEPISTATEPVAVEPVAGVEPATATQPEPTVEPATPTTAQGPDVTTPVEPVSGTAPEPINVTGPTTAKAPEPTPISTPAPEPVPAPKIAQTPEPEAPGVGVFQQQNPPQLPKPLQAGEPKYRTLRLSFASDIERALFQTSKANQTQKDGQYRQWLRGLGLTDTQINVFGQQLRTTLKKQYNQYGSEDPKTFKMPVARFVPAALKAAPEPTPVATTAAPTTAPVTTTQPTAQPTGPLVNPPSNLPFTQQETVRRDDPIRDTYETAAPGQDASKIVVRQKELDTLQKALPGAFEVLRELHARLFPGVETRLMVDYSTNTRGSSGFTSPTSTIMIVNPKVLALEFGGGDAARTKLLHTMFHELMHPVEQFYLEKAPAADIAALVKQYMKERNPSALRRAAIVHALTNIGKKASDPAFRKDLMKTLGVSETDLEAFMKSNKAKLPQGMIDAPDYASSIGQLRNDYYRNFTEWVAEKGAEWLVKEAKGLVPKTAFEKLQKGILDSLRNLFKTLTKVLGLPTRKGAFEKIMEDNYGKNKSVTSSGSNDSQINSKSYPGVIDYPRRNIGSPFKQGMELASNTEEDTAAPRLLDEQTTAPPSGIEAIQNKLASAYVPPAKMGFKGFIQAVKEAYQTGSAKDLGDKITRATSDRFIDLKRLDERFAEFLKKTGRAVQAAYDNRYALSANLSSYAGILARENVLGMLETVLKYGGAPIIKRFSSNALDGVLTVSRDGNQKGLTFLRDLIEKGKLDDFKYYAMAKRVLGRYSALQSPITEAEARELVAHYGKDPEVTEAYKAYQDFNKSMMKMAVDAGVISQDMANEFLKHNDYYPFYREMDETGRYTGPLFTQGVLTKTKIQAAIGGTEKLDADPIEVIMKNAQFWMHSAAKNLASQKIFKMMEELGEARPIKKGEALKPGEAPGVTRINGVEQHFAINNPDIAAALETTGAHQLPNWTMVPGAFTRFYRELVTRSPDFILKNIIRDPLSAMVTSGVNMNPFRAAGNLVTALRDKNNKNLMAIQNYGIVGGFRTIPGTEDASQLLNTNFKPTSNGIYVVPNGNVLTGLISKAWNKLGEVAEASDAATRMEIYQQVLKATGNEAEAAFRAQEYMNFRKQGNSSLIRYMSIMVPFINGRIQGLDVTARAFHKDNLPFTMLKGGYLMAVAMGLQAMFGDDDEYKQLPDYVRHGSLPIPLKALGLADSGFLAIPKPFEIGFVFQTVPEVIAQAMMGNIEQREIKRVALEQLKSTFGISLAPQFVSPIYELMINRSNLTGLPIVTDAMKNLPAELQYSSATSDIVKSLAGAAGLSPVQVEALIKGYGGQIGTMVLGLVDGMYRSATGTGLDKDWTQYPTISTFLKTQQNTNPKGAADVYRLSAEIQGLTTAINTYTAQGMAEKAMDLMQENRDLLMMKNSIAGLRTQLNTLSRTERMLVNNPNISQEQKDDQVQVLRQARRQIGNAMTNLIDRTGK